MSGGKCEISEFNQGESSCFQRNNEDADFCDQTEV